MSETKRHASLIFRSNDLLNEGLIHGLLVLQLLDGRSPQFDELGDLRGLAAWDQAVLHL